jgi:hypothetical protein
VYFNGKDAKAGYYLVPEKVPQDATKMWVAVDVHGAGGLRGEDRGKDLMQLLGPEPLIVIVPSFTDGYQAGDGKWAKQLIENFKEVAKNIPFAISCGDKDTALSTPDSARTRIAWYKLFEAEMKKEGFDVDGRTWGKFFFPLNR